jgi:hypothetical protein
VDSVEEVFFKFRENPYIHHGQPRIFSGLLAGRQPLRSPSPLSAAEGWCGGATFVQPIPIRSVGPAHAKRINALALEGRMTGICALAML